MFSDIKVNGETYMENDVKIYKARAYVKLLSFLMLLLALLCVHISFCDLKRDNILSYVMFIFFILTALLFIYIFANTLKKAIIISPEGIENRDILLPPPISSKRLTSRIKWEDIDVIKVCFIPLLKQGTYCIISKDKKIIAFSGLKNTKELVDYIEKKTEKKIEETGFFKKL